MSLLALLFAGLAAHPQSAPPPERPSMECEVGPLHRTFGGSRWILYSCVDGETLVMAADEGNPASPFYFILYPRDGGYHLYGEGAGSREASAAAMEELRALTPEGIRALIRQTQAR